MITVLHIRDKIKPNDGTNRNIVLIGASFHMAFRKKISKSLVTIVGGSIYNSLIINIAPTVPAIPCKKQTNLLKSNNFKINNLRIAGSPFVIPKTSPKRGK